MRLRILCRAALAILLVVVVIGVWIWSVITPDIGNLPTPNRAAGPILWTFGFVGDTHAGEDLVDEIYQRMRDAGVEFVLHLGDLVDTGDDAEQWRQATQQASRHGVRLLPVLGNHDKCRAVGDAPDRRLREFFPGLPGSIYGFRHRGLRFLMLDSECSFLPTSDQGQFLEDALAGQHGPTIACLHRPVFTCGRRDWANVLWRRMCVHGTVRDTETLLVLAGHNHYYERTKPLDSVTYVVSGGGTPSQYAPETPNQYTACFRAGRVHYGLVDVLGDRLRVRVLDMDGRLLDIFDAPLKRTSLPLHGAALLSETLPPLESLSCGVAEDLRASTATGM